MKISRLALGGHEYLPNGKSRGFNEDFDKAITPGYIFDGFGGENRKNVLRKAFEYGVNFFDVTMDSEKDAIGRNLQELGTPYEIYIQTRPDGMVYMYDPFNAKMADLNQLRNEAFRITKLLRRERIDFFNIAFMKDALDHDPDYLHKIAYNLNTLKKEGLIRFACADTFSGETTYLAQINSSAFDVIYINFNFADCEALEKVFPAVAAKKMGVVARETFMKGELFKFAEEAGIIDKTLLAHAAMKWVLSFDEVATLVYGSGKPHHVEDAMRLIDHLEMTDEEQNMIEIVKTAPGYLKYLDKKQLEFRN